MSTGTISVRHVVTDTPISRAPISPAPIWPAPIWPAPIWPETIGPETIVRDDDGLTGPCFRRHARGLERKRHLLELKGAIPIAQTPW